MRVLEKKKKNFSNILQDIHIYLTKGKQKKLIAGDQTAEMTLGCRYLTKGRQQ